MTGKEDNHCDESGQSAMLPIGQHGDSSLEARTKGFFTLFCVKQDFIPGSKQPNSILALDVVMKLSGQPHWTWLQIPYKRESGLLAAEMVLGHTHFGKYLVPIIKQDSTGHRFVIVKIRTIHTLQESTARQG